MSRWENFTADRVASLKCDVGRQQTIHWDGKTPGLGVRVTAKGAKSYIFETRLHGKTIRMTIGSPGTWPLETQWRKDKDTGERIEHRRGAREEAQRLKALTDQGIDPRQQQAEKRAKAEAVYAESIRQGLTLGDVWHVYLAYGKTKPRKKKNQTGWSARHYQDHIRLSAAGGTVKKRGKGLTVAGPLASLMHMPLSELSGEVVAEWLGNETAARPTMTALSYRLLRAFIRWANEERNYKGLIPEGSYSAKRVKDIVPSSEAKEDDCLQREQLPAWFQAVRSLSNPVVSAYLQALLITGARREEMAGLRWEDVDFQWSGLTIRDKVEGTRTIPLTPYLASLLLTLKQRNETPPNVRQLRRRKEQGRPKWKPSPWVFNSTTAADGKIAEPRLAHNAALAVAGLPHLTLHGLRRSFGTLAEWVEVPAGVVAQIMGHKPSATAEKHYRRRPLDLLRMWHIRIESWMLDQAGIKFEFEESRPSLRLVSQPIS